MADVTVHRCREYCNTESTNSTLQSRYSISTNHFARSFNPSAIQSFKPQPASCMSHNLSSSSHLKRDYEDDDNDYKVVQMLTAMTIISIMMMVVMMVMMVMGNAAEDDDDDDDHDHDDVDVEHGDGEHDDIHVDAMTCTRSWPTKHPDTLFCGFPCMRGAEHTCLNYFQCADHTNSNPS